MSFQKSSVSLFEIDRPREMCFWERVTKWCKEKEREMKRAKVSECERCKIEMKEKVKKERGKKAESKKEERVYVCR